MIIIRHSISLHKTFYHPSVLFRCVGVQGDKKETVIYEMPEACAHDVNAINVIRKHLQREVIQKIKRKNAHTK